MANNIQNPNDPRDMDGWRWRRGIRALVMACLFFVIRISSLHHLRFQHDIAMGDADTGEALVFFER